MAVINLRGVPDELAAQLKSEAALARMGYHEYCVAILEARGTVWPVYSLDGRTGAVSVITNAERGSGLIQGRAEANAVYSKKIADVGVGGGATEGGGDPSLPPLGKAQDGVEYSIPMLNVAGTECVRCHQSLDQHLAAICKGDDGTVVRTEFGNGYTNIPEKKSAALCDTTMTRRANISFCRGCGTYEGNLGPCDMWNCGVNGRCSYCDHGLGCHVATGLSLRMPQWSEERLREMAEAEPGGLMACSPEILANLVKQAQTDIAVASTLHLAGVKLDREILVRWGLAENYKPKTEESDGEGRNVEGRGAKGSGRGIVGGDSKADAQGHDVAQSGAVATGKPGVNMEALREICAGNIPLNPIPEQMRSMDKAKASVYAEFAKLCVACEGPLEESNGKLACPDESCGKYGQVQKGKK